VNAAQGANERIAVFANLLAFATLAFIYLYWSWTDQLVGFGGDNAFYVLAAQNFSPYGHTTSAAADYFTAHSQFPPLYPLLLALFDGGYRLLTAHLVTTSCLLLAFALLYMWARQLGLPALTSMAVTLAFAILPGAYSQTLNLHSENLYLLITLLFLTIRNNEHISLRFPYATSILVAAAALTRSAGITLVITFLIVLVIRRHRGWIYHATVSIVPVVLWNIYDYTLGSHYIQSLSLHNETSALVELVKRVSIQFAALEFGWSANLTASGMLTAQTLAIGVLCLIGTAWRLIKLQVDAIYATSYIALLLLWPFPSEATRFMFVIVPILLVHGAWLVRKLLSKIGQGNISCQGGILVPALVPAIAAIIALPDCILAVQRFQMDLPPNLEKYRRDPWILAGTKLDALTNLYTIDATIKAASSLRDHVAEKDCIFAIKPSIVGFYSGRISQAPPASSVSDEEFNSGLNRAGCRNFLLLNMASPSFNTPMYPLNRLTNRFEILRTYRLADDPNAPVAAQTGKLVDH
jgi:hypothetical protein